MTELKTCPFCDSAPVVHRQTKAPAYFKVECASAKCAMREVRTHACGDEESAIQVWNDRN